MFVVVAMYSVTCLAAHAMGASGVGLYRTEYLYLTHEDIPGEEEQLSAYREIIEASPGHSVTIRTLDIGGDKTVPYLGHNHQEANPFMGWRSIRLSFEHPEFFNTQVRAILRSAAYAKTLGGQVRLMFPMITTLEEMRRVRSFVRKACRKLKQDDKEFAEVPIGMMLEVPAAAVAIELMFDVVDFVSIGSNDLVQYLMAADRDNPKADLQDGLDGDRAAAAEGGEDVGRVHGLPDLRGVRADQEPGSGGHRGTAQTANSQRSRRCGENPAQRTPRRGHDVRNGDRPKGA